MFSVQDHKKEPDYIRVILQFLLLRCKKFNIEMTDLLQVAQGIGCKVFCT